MSIEIFDLDGGVGNIIIGSDIITDIEFVGKLENHLRQDKRKLQKYRYSIADYTAVKTSNVSRKAIEKVAKLCNFVASDLNSEVVFAAIANRDPIYGQLMMWELLASITNWEYMAFQKKEDAEIWIKERVKERFGIFDLTFKETS